MYSPVFSIEFERRRRIHSPNLFYDRYFCIIVTGCVIRTEFFSAQILIIQSIRPHRRREWNGLSAGKQTTAKKEGRKELERKMCTMPRAPVYIHLSLLGEYSKEVLRILFTFKGKEEKKKENQIEGHDAAIAWPSLIIIGCDYTPRPADTAALFLLLLLSRNRRIVIVSFWWANLGFFVPRSRQRNRISAEVIIIIIERWYTTLSLSSSFFLSSHPPGPLCYSRSRSFVYSFGIISSSRAKMAASAVVRRPSKQQTWFIIPSLVPLESLTLLDAI